MAKAVQRFAKDTLRMIDILKFVKGSIKTNSLTPEFTHYSIGNNRITGFNGYMAISAPFPLDISARPLAKMFYDSIESCSDVTSINMANGKLLIKSGKFKANIPCIEHELYEAKPEGDSFPVPPNLIQNLRTMLPFVGDDVTRSWSMGIGIVNGCYMATNNIVFVQLYDGHSLPAFNIPVFAVKELIRIDETPVSIMVGSGTVSFIYSDNKWIQTSLIEANWPFETINKLLSKESSPQPFPEGFFNNLESLKKFMVEGKRSIVYLSEEGVSTHADHSVEGAFIQQHGLQRSAFMYQSLLLLKDVVVSIDLSNYPNPCLFFGNNMRGAIIGYDIR